MMISNKKMLKYILLTVIIFVVLISTKKSFNIHFRDCFILTLLVVFGFIVSENVAEIFISDDHFAVVPGTQNDNITADAVIVTTIDKYNNALLTDKSKQHGGNNTANSNNSTDNTNNDIADGDKNNKDNKENTADEDNKDNKDDNSDIDASSDNNNAENKNDKKEYKSDVRLARANDKEREGCRWRDGVIGDDLKYTDYNHMPMSDNNRNYEYGYSFLPPEKWYPQPPFPPICVTNNPTEVSALYTTGTPVDVKEWNNSLRITGPDNINVKYITEKLNAGR